MVILFMYSTIVLRFEVGFLLPKCCIFCSCKASKFAHKMSNIIESKADVLTSGLYLQESLTLGTPLEPCSCDQHFWLSDVDSMLCCDTRTLL